MSEDKKILNQEAKAPVEIDEAAEKIAEINNQVKEVNVEVDLEPTKDKEIEEVIYDINTPVKAKDERVFGRAEKAPENFAPGSWNPFAVKESRFVKKDTTFETRLLQVKRVIKVTKGGRRFKFSALVVVGDKMGRVGYASAKDIEIPNAISKAERLAKKNLYKVKIIGDNKTVAHDVTHKFGSAKVLLKPAIEGKGIIASNNIRAVVELAGYHNIYSKNLGTSNPKNVVIATIQALISMRTKDEISKLRDKNI